eukprot:1160276-Pelagomonas_calceolata.AAC.13
MNPNGKFPLLVTPGGPIFESNAICRFIATHSPQPTGIYPEPTSAEVRERVEQLLEGASSMFGDPGASRTVSWTGLGCAPFWSKKQFKNQPCSLPASNIELLGICPF